MLSNWASSTDEFRAYHGTVTENANGTNYALVCVQPERHLLTKQKFSPCCRVDVSKLIFSDNVQVLSSTITSRIAEIEGDRNVDGQWMGLNVSIASISLEQLGESK